MKKFFAIMTVVLVAVMMVVPAFAYEMADSKVTVDVEKTEYMQTQHDNGLTYLTVTRLYDMNTQAYVVYGYMSTMPLQVNSSGGQLVATSPGKYTMVFSGRAGQQLTYNTSGVTSISGGSNVASTSNTVLWSSYDCYKTNGELVMEGDDGFFPPPPLAEVIQGVTADTLQSETIPALNRVVKAVVVAGLTCLACLVGLVVLKKVFPMFGAR